MRLHQKNRNTLLIFLPFLTFLVTYFIVGFFVQSTSQPTPLVLGKNLQQAVSILSEKHLSLRLIREKIDATVQPGTIIDQIPKPGANIRPNQHVFVTIAAKPQPKLMPKIRGLRLDEAVNTCESVGISAVTVTVVSPLPEGLCVGQNPAPGNPIERSAATLFISGGQNKLAVMPDLIGLSYPELEKRMKGVDVRLAFSLPEDLTEPNSELFVSDQQPEAGAIVMARGGQTIQIELRRK